MKQQLLILLFILSSFFLHSQNIAWKTNMNDAILLSDEQRKPMLIFFTASGISQAIQDEVFATADFANWSAKSVVLLKVDLSDSSLSNIEREQNIKLKEALGIANLPQVCLVRASIRKNKPTINKLGLVDYKLGGAKKWISEAKNILLDE